MKKIYALISKIALGTAFLAGSALVAEAQNFGVDVANPQEKMDVNGAIRIGNTSNSNAGTIRYSSVSHKFQVNMNGTWYDLATTSNSQITNVNYNPTTNIITISEGGNNFTVDLTELEDNTDDQSISYNSSTNVITLEDGGTVDLSDLQDNTDNQTLSDVYGEGGNAVQMDGTSGDVRFFKVGNEIFMLKESNGYVGIGTNNPTSKLHVTESSSDNAIQVTESGDGDGMNISEDGNGNGLTVTAGGTGHAATFMNGNVGIGTTNPANKLEVDGDVRVTGLANANGAVIQSDVNGDLSPSPLPNDNDQVLDGTGNWVDINTMVSGDYIENQTSTDQAAGFRITGDGLFNGGNVGVGTTIPTSTLNVYDPSSSATQTNFTQATGDAGVLITTDYANGNYTPGVFWTTQNENPTKPKAGIYLQTNTAGSKMILSTSTDYPTGITNNALVVDQDERVGIGTINPAQALEIYRNDADVAVRFHDPGNYHYAIGIDRSDAGKFKINYGAGVGDAAHFTMTTSGSVGIGSANPAQALDVVGDINASTGYRIANGATAGQYLRGNGSKFVSSSIQAGDLPGGNGNYIQNQISGAQSSSNFWISGSGRAGGDMRAPLFYDQDNTSYYVDPAGTSRVYKIGFNSQNTINSGLYLWSTGDNNHVIYSVGTGQDGGARQAPYWDTGHRMRFRTATSQGFTFENSSNTTIVDIDSDNGNMYVAGQVRTPIMYDLNNTGYYVDPASTSNMNTVIANSNIYNGGWYRGGTSDNGHVRLYGNSRQMVFRTDGSTQYSDNGGYPFVWLYGGDNSGNRRMILHNNGNIWTSSYGWLHDYFAATSGDGSYIQNQNSGAQSANFYISGNGQVNGELYVGNWIRKLDNDGIYWQNNQWHLYPVNSTDFYLRSGSTSEISLRLVAGNTTPRGYLYANSSNQMGFLNNARQWHLRSLTADGLSPNLYFVESGNESWSGNPGNDEGKVEYHSNRLYLAAGANSTEVVRFRRSGSDVGLINNSGYAYFPIMYDWNDNGYYTDPASWSRQYGLGSFYLRNNYGVSTDHPYGVYYSNDLSTAYAIYREPGGWSNPYPDLRIAFHTGIKLGAHANYQGIRFYNNHDMATLVMAVNDGSTSGSGNVYMTGNLGVGGTNGYRLYAAGDIYANGGWMRVSGGRGLYFQSYGGGWYMTESSWVRSYNGKSVLSQVNNGTPAIRGDQAYSGWYAGEFRSYNNATGPALYSYGYNVAYNYYYTSSRTKKHQIKKFEEEDYESALAFMDELELNYYRMKGDDEYPKIHVGLIAEETPTTLTAPGKIAVSYGELAIYATGAVKALKKEVNTLKGQLNKVSDFGAENIHTNKMWVEFSKEFKSMLNGEDPVVVLTPSQSGSVLNLIDVNKEGFEVENPNNKSITFSWIAMANVEVEEIEEKYSERFDAALKSAENDTRPIPVQSYPNPTSGEADPSAPVNGVEKDPQVELTTTPDPNLPAPETVGERIMPLDISKDAVPTKQSIINTKPTQAPAPRRR